jgi:hypothetical protein
MARRPTSEQPVLPIVFTTDGDPFKAGPVAGPKRTTHRSLLRARSKWPRFVSQRAITWSAFKIFETRYMRCFILLHKKP